MSAVEGYEAFDDPYVYPGTNVLKNRHRIRDAARLEAFELEMSTLRSTEPLPAGRLDPRHFRAVHRHLFQDIYTWAGRYRTVRIAKQGSVFCYPERIDASMRRLFEASRPQLLRPTGHAAFIDSVASFLAELNAIHAFREGNGRAQLSFLHLIGIAAGHRLSLDRVQPQSMLTAMVASFHGDIAPLTRVLAGLGSRAPRKRRKPA